MIGIALLSVCVVGLVMLIMAVGPIFSRRCLRGSCGGPPSADASSDGFECETCPLRQPRRKAGP